MFKRLAAGLASAIAAHAAAGILFDAPAPAIAASAGVDVVLAIAVSAFTLRSRARTSDSERAEPSAGPQADPSIPSLSPLPAAALSFASEASRAESSHASQPSPDFSQCESLLDSLLDETRLRGEVMSRISAVSESLSSLREAIAAIEQNAAQVTAVADNLAASSEQGFTLAVNVQKNTQTIDSEVKSSTREIAELLEESKKISEIVTIMSEISATTNVLSINASIVAARAGAKGREFDVVAKEVRKLSVGTDEALRNISALVASIQNRIRGMSARLETIAFGILKENEAMLSVGGALQGISLGTEVIRSVSGVSGERSRESGRNLENTERLIASAVNDFSAVNAEQKIRDLRDKMQTIRSRLV